MRTVRRTPEGCCFLRVIQASAEFCLLVTKSNGRMTLRFAIERSQFPQSALT